MEEPKFEAPTGHAGTAMAAPSPRQLPLPPMPPVPPPKDDKVSRYRSLRGKSVSSPPRNYKPFDIYRDDGEDDSQDDGPDASPTRGRSLSAAAMRGNAAKRIPEKGRQTPIARPPLPTIKSALNPKPINLSSPNTSNRFHLQASKSVGFVRPTTPEPRPRQEDLIGGDIGKNQKPNDRAEAARWADEVARLEAETDRILAEQKKRDIARLQAQLAAAPSPKPKPKRLILEKFTFLRSPRPNAPGFPTTPKSAPAKILAFTWSPATANANRTPSFESMRIIEPGGKGIVPQIDAPTSASNGGERVSDP